MSDGLQNETESDENKLVSAIQANRLEILLGLFIIHSLGLFTKAQTTISGCV